MNTQKPSSHTSDEAQPASFSQGNLQMCVSSPLLVGRHSNKRGSSGLPVRLAARMHSVSDPQPRSTHSPSSQAWNRGHSSFSVHGFSQKLFTHASSSSSQSSSSRHSTQRLSSQMSE